MDQLPFELVTQIMSILPESSLLSCRLVNRTFAAISFRFVFSHVPIYPITSPLTPKLTDIDSTMARLQVLSWSYILSSWSSSHHVVTMVHCPSNAHREANDSRALEPNVALNPTWVSICERLLHRYGCPPARLLDTGNDQLVVGEEPDADEKRLRMGQNRFLLWRGLREEWDWNKARIILEWKVDGLEEEQNDIGASC